MQFWGRFDAPAQVAILLSASIVSFLGTMWLHRRDASGYFTKLAALVAFACFVINTVMAVALQARFAGRAGRLVGAVDCMVRAGLALAGFALVAYLMGRVQAVAVAELLAFLAVLLESKAPPDPGALAPDPETPADGPRLVYWAVLGATTALAIFFLANLRPPLHAGHGTPDLIGLLPASPSGWQVETPTDLYQFAGVLQTSHLAERTYLRGTSDSDFTQVTVYVAFWSAGQASVSRVASHTPDASWPGAGWSPRPLLEIPQSPGYPGLAITPGEQRLFQNADGYLQNVWFWHIYDGRVISFRDPYSVPALIRLVLQYGFRRQGDQYFVRISSNKPWHELEAEPLVRDILTKLAALGL
jgi:hypothetical protein